ncbi:MAG TPA: hypothetical protein VL981_08885 [Candidatus Methylacidiphilales bacterium]|nr:hypothetical protein [Candidatus Methylacidiphilales bacterium]
MSDKEKRHLILVVGDVNAVPPALKEGARVFTLTEAAAREALEEIFAADTVAVWGDVHPNAKINQEK